MQGMKGLSIIVAGLFFSMLALLDIGRRIGMWRRQKDTQGADSGLGVVDGAVFGLMGLMIAFAFSGAGARFDAGCL